MAPYRGLESLRSPAQEAVLWVDLETIVDRFTNPDFEVICYQGLGKFLSDSLRDHPEWSESEQQRFVGEELAKAFNGLLQPGAYEQDIFSEAAEFRNAGDACTGQHKLTCDSADYLPADKRVSVATEKQKEHQGRTRGNGRSHQDHWS